MASDDPWPPDHPPNETPRSETGPAASARTATATTIDGGSVEIENMDDTTVLDMVAELEEWNSAVMAFSLDDDTMTYIVRQNIARVDVEPSAELESS